MFTQNIFSQIMICFILSVVLFKFFLEITLASRLPGYPPHPSPGISLQKTRMFTKMQLLIQLRSCKKNPLKMNFLYKHQYQC